MDYKGHLKSGTLLGVIAVDRLFNPSFISVADIGLFNLSAISLGLIIGSGLPDIDHHKSFIAKKLSAIGWIVSKFFSHRGFTHSLSFLLLLYFSFRLGEKHISGNYIEMYSWFFITLIFSTAIHILMDMFIGNGVKLLLPLYSKKVSFTKIRSGTKKEKTFHKFIFFSFTVYFVFQISLFKDIALLVKSFMLSL